MLKIVFIAASLAVLAAKCKARHTAEIESLLQIRHDSFEKSAETNTESDPELEEDKGSTKPNLKSSTFLLDYQNNQINNKLNLANKSREQDSRIYHVIIKSNKTNELDSSVDTDHNIRNDDEDDTQDETDNSSDEDTKEDTDEDTDRETTKEESLLENNVLEIHMIDETSESKEDNTDDHDTDSEKSISEERIYRTNDDDQDIDKNKSKTGTDNKGRKDKKKNNLQHKGKKNRSTKAQHRSKTIGNDYDEADIQCNCRENENLDNLFCGSNWENYYSECQMDCDARKTKQEVYKLYDGICRPAF